METTVFIFKINGTFGQWSSIFDSNEAKKRHDEYEIKPLYRGVSKQDAKKVIVIHQHPPGAIEKFLEANGDWIATHDVDLASFEQTVWNE
ncbi:DUF3764 family protein [Prochlorococcus sp. MIT 1223]|uniref:DUF3764 family protein n=1 Tax=Prochlorococcus sp. MIT 1223 TaxID=3096217 RepID=UPI002A74D083|nr:DUF3764 family protein [Prochlorococcus sp. MIT 1223]|tara:strand:+ start:132 stop:401 length:270 start_codon:yes stop_codon:yes gene_type:complete